MNAHTITFPASARQDRDTRGGHSAGAVTIMAAGFLAAIFAVAAKGVGGEEGLAAVGWQNPIRIWGTDTLNRLGQP
jgi:hypothetical protein